MPRFLSLLLCTLMALVAGQDQGTVHSADTNAGSIKVLDAGAPPAATTEYVPAPIPVATEDSTTFRKVPNPECSEKVSGLVSQIYSKNRDLFDSCAEHSQYQIFPFSGVLPTPEQIYSLATTKACTAMFTACVLADLPQCDISALGLKSVTESLLKVTVDVDEGKPAPDTKRFHEMHFWRRDVNLAQAAGLPYGNDSQLYAEYSRNLWIALTKYNVRVLPDLTIEYDLADLTSAVNGTGLNDKPSSLTFNITDNLISSSSSSSSSSGKTTAGSGSNATTVPSSAATTAAAMVGSCAAIATALVVLYV